MIVQVEQHAGNNIGRAGLKAAFKTEDVATVVERNGFREPSRTTYIHLACGLAIETVATYAQVLGLIGWKVDGAA